MSDASIVETTLCVEETPVTYSGESPDREQYSYGQGTGVTTAREEEDVKERAGQYPPPTTTTVICSVLDRKGEEIRPYGSV